MLDRQRIATFGVTAAAAATVVLAVWLKPWKPQESVTAEPVIPSLVEPAAAEHTPVDVVFAIDTTGSMGGLLDSAKRAVWSIAVHIRDIDPQADVRVGLVAYRDIHDEYITKDFPLTSDLDAVYAELTNYVAAGGGDIPEDVDAGLYDAVHKMQWRAGATKLMFVVGDAPPASRGDVPSYDLTAREAGTLGIRINAIRCGTSPDTAAAWQRIASLGHGEFSTIAEDGGVTAVATPYDAKMAELSARVDDTAVIYGDGTVHAAYAKKMAVSKSAPAPEAAARASYYQGKSARAAEDVVGKALDGDLDVDKLEPAKLPSDLAAMPKPALAQELQRRAADRAAAQRELDALAKQRAAYLADKARKDAPRTGLDATVNAAVDAQLKK